MTVDIHMSMKLAALTLNQGRSCEQQLSMIYFHSENQVEYILKNLLMYYRLMISHY
jgi:hypothetical protein